MLPARSFYLIRHGQSVANESRITAGGRTDSPLTEKGRGQARFLGPYLKGLEVAPDIIYHSDMARARETAQILNDSLHLPMTELHDLREHELGAWEGRPWAEIEPLIDSDMEAPGGETHQQFAQRIQATFTQILEKGHKMPMIVAHGGLFHAMGFLYEYGMAEVQNCHLHMFEPWPTYDTFPWKVWQVDVIDGALKKKAAPFCLSHTMAQIA